MSEYQQPSGYRKLLQKLSNFQLYKRYFYAKEVGLDVNAYIIEEELIKRIKK